MSKSCPLFLLVLIIRVCVILNHWYSIILFMCINKLLYSWFCAVYKVEIVRLLEFTLRSNSSVYIYIAIKTNCLLKTNLLGSLNCSLLIFTQAVWEFGISNRFMICCSIITPNGVCAYKMLIISSAYSLKSVIIT